MQDIFEKVLEESECLVFTRIHGSEISIHGSVALVTLGENVRSTEAPGVGVSCREREREHNIKYYVQLNQIQKLREKLYSKMEEPKQTMEEPKQTMEEPKQTMEEPKQTMEEPKQTMEEVKQTMEEPKQTMDEPKQTMEEPKQTMEEPKQTASFISVAW